MMKEIDISILSREPNNTEEVTLIIEPLAPLSMVTDLPGSYYKSQRVPSKKMLCGLIENIIGWRFSGKIRADILNTIKRGKKKLPKYEEGSTYKPLLLDYFDIEGEPIVSFDSVSIFDDMWSRHFCRPDVTPEYVKSYRNISKALINDWNDSTERFKNDKEEKIKVDKLFRKRIPNFYPVLPTKREYIDLKNGTYIYKVRIDPTLLSLFEEHLSVYNIGYLGNSEGWINICIKRL